MGRIILKGKGKAAGREEEDDVECRDLSSTCLSVACYDEGEGKLDVVFTETGARHRYFGVPPEVVKALMASGSKGRFYNRFIKGRFSRRRMRG